MTQFPRFAPWLAFLVGAGCDTVPTFRGVDVVTGQSVTMRPTSMPAGSSFSGTYFSAQTGTLYLTQRGGTLGGRYAFRWCSCDFVGTIAGTVEGNLARVTWKEEVSGCLHDRSLQGQGYLFYRAAPEPSDRPGRLYGYRDYIREAADGQEPPSHVDPRIARIWTAQTIAPGEIALLDDDATCP